MSIAQTVGGFFGTLFSGTIGRFIRGAVATAAGSWLVSVQQNELYIALTPTLLALSKFLRDRYPSSMWEMLPF